MSDLVGEGFVRVGTLADFPPGRARTVLVGARRVALFNVAGRLHALRDACPHMGASLADGTIDAGRVTCSWHGWSFDLVTGASGRRSGACARVYELRVEDGGVWLREPASPEPAVEAEADDWIQFDPEQHLKPGE